MVTPKERKVEQGERGSPRQKLGVPRNTTLNREFGANTSAKVGFC